MTYREFDGQLDDDKDKNPTYRPFDGQLDTPAPSNPGVLTRIAQAIRDYPILAPGEEDPGVMGRVKPADLAAKAPASMGAFYDGAMEKAMQREMADPLDPRLAAIAPGDALARLENEASRRRTAGNASWARVMEDAAREKDRDAAEHRAKLATYSPENLAGNTVKNVRNVTAGVLKIGPTALKGVFDIAQLATGGEVGKDGSEAMREGMKAIDEVIADPTLGEQGRAFSALMSDPNAGLADMYEFLKANPEILLDNGITTVGSMFLPAGAAKAAVAGARLAGAGTAAAGTAATVASLGTVAAQNSSDTFTSEQLAGASMEDRYKAAAVSAGMSVLAGMLFRGGAEGEIARRMAGIQGVANSAGGLVKAMGREGAQEMGEELGNAAGEAVGSLEAPAGNNLAKRVAFAGALGAMFGGVSHASGAGVQPDDGSAAAEAARQAALAKWANNGLSPNQAPPAAPGGRIEPTWNGTATPPQPPAPPAPTVADIGAASSVDDAIAAAQAVLATPSSSSAASSPYATAAEIDALEQAAGMLDAGQLAESVNLPVPAAAELEAAPIAPAVLEQPAAPAPSVWRRANDPTIPTLTDVLAPADGIPTLTDEVPGQAPIPTLTDVFSGPIDGDQDWRTFPAETKTLNIPRAEMPQIKAEHRGALTQFLKARGITHDEVEVVADHLKPTQREFSVSKVQQAIDYQGGNRAILVSMDGHVLDGHHQWIAAASKGEEIRVIKLNAPIRQLLDVVKEFPSATTSEGAPGAAPSTSWAASPFAPRIDKMLGDLRAAGADGMADAIASGFESDMRHNRLNEEGVSFREDKARQAIADRARQGGQVTPAPFEPITAEGLAKITNTAAALPAPIVAAAVKKWNAIAPKLAELGYKQGEAHSNAPPEAQALERQLKNIIQALDGLAPRRYQAAKGHKNAKPGHLQRAEEFATLTLGIKTKRYPGVDTSMPITLGTGVADPQLRAMEARRRAEQLRERLRQANPFLAFLANHGIAPADRADLGVEKGAKGNPPVPGYGPVIRKTGKRLDELALLARDDGFLTDRDIEATDDTGGTRKLASMIQRALANKEVILPPAAIDGSMPTADQRLLAEAESLGLATEGKTADQLYDEVTAAHQARDDRREAIGAASVDEQALIENYADEFTPAETELVGQLLDADIPLDGGLSFDNLTDEDIDAIFGIQPGRGARASGEETEGTAAGDSRQGAEGAATASEGETDLLTSYSAADVVAREEAAAARAKALQAEADRLERQRKREQHERERQQRIAGTVDDFQLGQTAEEALEGQRDIFSAPPAAGSLFDQPATSSKADADEDQDEDADVEVDDAAIDRAATEGYQAGKRGKLMPPISLEGTLLDAWYIGNRRAIEEDGGGMFRDVAPAPAPVERQLEQVDQVRVHKYNADQARPLLLIACSGAKHPGRHKAVDLYKGVLFDVLRKWMPAEGKRPDIYIISAEHGLVHADTMLDNYEREMTPERQAELMKKGLDISDFKGKNFSQVYIAGGDLYRGVGRVYAEQLKKAGHLASGAEVLSANDGDGVGKLRGHLGQYLRQLGGDVLEAAPTITAAPAPAAPEPGQLPDLTGQATAVAIEEAEAKPAGDLSALFRATLEEEAEALGLNEPAEDRSALFASILEEEAEAMGLNDQAPAGPQPVNRESFLNDGTTVYDGQGKPYRVHYQRNALVIAHPIVDGKPQVSADTSVRFWTDPSQQPASENDRLDPIYTEAPATALEGEKAKLEGQRKRTPYQQVEDVNENWRKLYAEHSAWFTGDGPTRKLRADAPAEVRQAYDAHLAAKKAAKAAMEGPAPDKKPRNTIANNLFATPNQEADRLNAMLVIERTKKAKTKAKTAEDRKKLEKERLAAMQVLQKLPAGRFTEYALDAIRMGMRNGNEITNLLEGPDSALARAEATAQREIDRAKKDGKDVDRAYAEYNRDGDANLTPEYFRILWDGKDQLAAQQTKTKGATKVNKQRAAEERVRLVLGASVGDTITMTFKGNVGYLTSGKPMLVDRVSSTGEVYFKDPETGAGTSEKLALLEAYAKHNHIGLKWEVTPKATDIKTSKQLNEQAAHSAWSQSTDPVQKALVRPVAKLEKIPDVYQSLKKAGDIAPQVADYIAEFRKDLRGEVNDVMRAELGYRKKAGQWVKDDRTAGQAAADAAKNTAIGYAAALGGIGEVLGLTPKKAGVMPFEESTYQRVAPYFTAAVESFKEAAHDVKTVMRIIVRDLLKMYGKEGAAKMEPYVLRYIDDLESGKIKLNGESDNADNGTDADSEGNPGNGQDVEPEAEPDVFDVRDGLSRGTRAPGARPDEAGPGSADRAGVPGRDAADGGAQGDRRVPGGDGSRRPGAGTAEPRDTGGSGDRGRTGTQPGPDADLFADEGAGKRVPLDEKRQQQLAAEKVDVIPGDRANIDATLPYLLEGQRDDVHFAETRFAQADKEPGVLFTNGTGTGKTFTGLGIAKRFERMGKGNGIIVVPNNEIAQDWIKSGQALGLNITALESTTDAGAGMVITTYANFGNNPALADREWDFVLPDEAHYLMASKDGKMTDALQTLRALTRHPLGFHRYSRMVNRDLFEKLAALPAAPARANGNQAERTEHDKLWKQIQEREEGQRADFEAVAASNLARPKAVFLSATPFAYIKAVDWAEGYLFSYGEGGRIGNSNQDGRAHFFVQHFGYRIRYHKLTEPDANVDQGLMARQFNTWLKSQGALSGRMLDVEADYDRKFVMIPSALGTKIDEGLEFIREHDEYKHLYQPMMKQFDYLSRRYLLEAIKAKEALPMIQEHLDRGRKVIIIHDYKKGGAFNPFLMSGVSGSTGYWDGDKYVDINLADLAAKFRVERRDLVNLKFPTQSALQILSAAFPGALVHNGDVPSKQLEANKRLFNADNFDNPIIILQADKGREGISLHDTIGRHMRVQVNVGMPGKPTSLIQLEGRSYRTGQVTDAAMRYVTTGTMWERWTFAQTIAERADIAEALAMGDLARGLKESIIEAYEDAGQHPASDDDGKGGKARDRQNAQLLTEWDRAKSFYYGQLKRNSSSKSQEGKDYFATPEPVGFKMVEWADIRPGEAVLEPSAGHGAIARWFPIQSAKTIVEPETPLITKARLHIDGAAKFVQGKFEDLHLVNKFDTIVMNPPFGKGGATSTPHLAKAYKHLNEGGRIVALLPAGPDADKRFDKFLYGEDAPKDLHLVAHIMLPGATFSRAGTGAMTRIVVLDKLADADQAPNAVHRDYTHIEDVEGLFDALQYLTLPGRAKTETGEDIAIEEAKPAPAATRSAKQAAPGATGAARYFAQFEFDHTKTGARMYGASMLNRVSMDAYKDANAIAKQHGGYYNKFASGDAKRGFLFKTAEARQAFMEDAGNLGEVSAGLDGQNSLSGDLGTDSALLDHMEEISDHRGMFTADKLLEWVRTQAAPGAAGLANWLEVQRGALVTPSSVVKYMENSSNAMFSRVDSSRRQFLAAAAAAAIAPNAAAGDVKLGQAKALTAAVLDQRIQPAVERILRDGQEDGTTSLNGMKALRDALRAMSMSGPKELRALARQLANLMPTEGTLMLTVDGRRRMNVHGAVSLAPFLHLQLFTAGNLRGLTYETILHEAMHVVIAARYRSLSVGLVRGNDKLLGLSAPAAAKALEQFEALWNEFRDLTRGEKFGNKALELAVTEARGNPDEFFVRALTDPILQAYLAGKRYEGKTMWQRFKDWVKSSLFGLRESGTAPSWLDAALAASGDVLEAMRGDRGDFARMRAISQYQDGRRGQSMRSAANDDSAAASTSPLTMAARKRFDQVMVEAEHWLKSNGKTASLTDLEPRWAMDHLDMMMGFGVGNLSEAAKAQGRAIWDRASEAYKNLARRGGELEVGPDELYARASSVAPTWTVPDMTMQDNIIQTLQDKHIDMKRTVQTIRDQVGQLADKWDPYLQEELFHGRAATGFKSFLDDELRPLLTDMQARGVTMQELEQFLHMRHAEEANDRLASINQGNPDGLAGVSTADARAYLANLTPAQRQAYGALAARVDAIIAGTQRALVAYGLEKQETIDTWNATYQHYVPLMREDMDGPLAGNGTGAGFSVRGSASRNRMGSRLAVVDILANVAMARERAIVRGEKNRLDLALYGLALQAPNPDFWKPVNPLKNPAAVQAELVNMGLSPALVQTIIDEPRQRIIDKKTGMVTTRLNPLLRDRPNVVAVRVNGEDRFIFFNDKNDRAMRMAIALKNLGNDGLGRFLSVVGIGTRWFAAVNTQYNPIFGIVNFTRDLGEGAINLESTPIAGQQAAFAKEAGRLLPKIAKRQGFGISVSMEHLTGADAALWQEFQAEGGITGYRAMFNTSEDRAKQLGDELRKMQAGVAGQAFHAVKDWLSDYNEALENVTRMAAYKVAKAEGMTNQQAASLAKNLTVNFNRKGAVGSQVNALFAFFNAATQGIARMGTTLASPAGKTIIAGGVLLGVIQAFMLMLADYDDDNPPEFVKAKNFIIPLGLITGKKDYLSIPYPLGYSFLPTIGRTTTEFALGGGKRIGKHLTHLVGALVDTFNPLGSSSPAQLITPTVGDPIVDLWGNKDGLGRDIARKDFSSLRPTPGHTRTKDTASAVGKALSYYLNAITGGNKYTPGLFSPTPDQIDYLTGQLFGGVGREALKAQQTVSSIITGEELPAHKVPLAGRFYGQADDKSATSTKFYENLKTLNVKGAELEGRRKDKDGAREFLADNPDARLADLGESVERDIAALRRRKADLIEKGADKARIKELELQMRKVMERFNKKVEEVKAKSAA